MTTPGAEPPADPPPPGWRPDPDQTPPGWAPPSAPAPGAGARQTPWTDPYTDPFAAPSPPPGPPPGVPGWNVPTGWAPRAVHKPGAIPLRPLGLSDIFDASFKIIRHNAQATVGAALLVTGVALGAPILVTALLGLIARSGPDTATGDGSVRLFEFGMIGLFVLGALVASIGLVLVTGMVSQVCAAAAVGRTMTLGQAWRATAGSRWRLIGLTLTLALAVTVLAGLYVLAWFLVVSWAGTTVIVLWAVFSIPLFTVLLVVFWVRLYLLGVPALMIERLGVFAAIRRGASLTSGHFFRVLGVALLAWLVTQIASSVIGTPFSLVSTAVSSGIGDDWIAALVLVVGQALGMVLGTALVAPFSACVTALQYLDLRIRKEAYDVELLARSTSRVP